MCLSLPSLYASLLSKGAWVADVWNVTIGEGQWNLCFSIHFNDSELGIVKSFFSRLQDKSVSKEIINRMIWEELKIGVFPCQIPLLCLRAEEVNSLPFSHHLESLGPN